uniref:PX domain-containing protein n=1 Tax=Rhizochromulina marina TaxID=1034831 RepID=A0A7S2WVJ8_9STRA|mmetsp:Transcript_8492/g.24156  ORF Transcript_8492/g.24156 Transcript_8492/m.24156 type:complete len:772 (+) Transcript_8492:51-2366(+)
MARRSSLTSESAVDARGHSTSSNLTCKVTAFVPGVDLVDGRCDIDQASYYMQIYADGDVYDIRRTALAFFEIDQRLMKRFPKMNLPVMPLYQLPGASAFSKQTIFKSRSKARVLLSVDEMLAAQGKLNEWIADIITFEPVLSSEELRNFLTEQASEVSARANADYDSKVQQAEARFGKGAKAESVEELLLEALPITRVKVQPGASHTIRVSVERPGDHIVWGFTTLPGKTSPAKDIAFSVTFNDSPVRAYERCVNAPYQLLRGYWTIPSSGEVRLTWHNDYSKWYAKHVALKVVLAPDGQLRAAHRRIKKIADARQERLEQKGALLRAVGDGEPRAEARGSVSHSHHGLEGQEESTEVVSLRKENQNLQMAIADLTQENTNQRNQLEKLTFQLQENRGNEDLEKVLVKRTQQVHSLEAELLSEQKGHHQARERYVELRKHFQDKLEEVNELQGHLRHVEAQLEKYREDRRTLKVVAKQYKDESEKKTGEIQSLQHQLGACRQEANDIRAQMAATGGHVGGGGGSSGGGDTGGGISEEQTPAEDEELWIRRLQTFYQRYFLGKADRDGCLATMRKFQGKEVELFTVLYHKYDVLEKEQIFHTLFAPHPVDPPSADKGNSSGVLPSPSPPSSSSPVPPTVMPKAAPAHGNPGSFVSHMVEWQAKASTTDFFPKFSGNTTQIGSNGILNKDLVVDGAASSSFADSDGPGRAAPASPIGASSEEARATRGIAEGDHADPRTTQDDGGNLSPKQPPEDEGSSLPATPTSKRKGSVM